MPLFPILYWKGGFFLPADARIKSVAVLLDGGFVRKRLRALLGHQPSAAEIRELAFCLLGPDEELFRISYYDCYQPQEWAHNPLSGERMDSLFSTHPDPANRIDALRRIAQEMGSASEDGISGRSGRQVPSGPWG